MTRMNTPGDGAQLQAEQRPLSTRRRLVWSSGLLSSEELVLCRQTEV